MKTFDVKSTDVKSTESLTLAEGVRSREVWAWAMFDFANSGYTTVVITAVFNAYFVAVVTQDAVWGTFAWTAALSVSYALIVVTAPLLGAYADVHAAKKRLLLLSTAGCILATAALGLVGPRRPRAWNRAAGDFEFLLWYRRKPDCRFLA